MLFIISIAFATPTDLPSGECATDVDTTVQRSGKELYETHCATCHQADGTGEKGFFPPVIGTPWVESSAALTEVLLRGVSGTIYVNGERYASYMSPYGKELTDEEMIQLITYIRTDMNNYPTDDKWTKQMVKELRTNLNGTRTIRGQKELDALISVGSPSVNKTKK